MQENSRFVVFSPKIERNNLLKYCHKHQPPLQVKDPVQLITPHGTQGSFDQAQGR